MLISPTEGEGWTSGTHGHGQRSVRAGDCSNMGHPTPISQQTKVRAIRERYLRTENANSQQ